MATTFSERLNRLDEGGKLRLYAGDEAPQDYKSANLIAKVPKTKRFYVTALFVGALFGALAGYMFKTYIGLGMIFAQPPLMLFAIFKSDATMAATALGVLIGPIATIGFLIFSASQTRLLQFWTAYLIAMLAINAQSIWYFYLTMQASA